MYAGDLGQLAPLDTSAVPLEALQDKVATLAGARTEQATAAAAVRKTVAGSTDARRALEALDFAIKALQDLQQSGRLVGII